MNHVKTALPLGLLAALFAWAGCSTDGQAGIVIAIVFAGLMNLHQFGSARNNEMCEANSTKCGDKIYELSC